VRVLLWLTGDRRS